jgi:hypothetical protein
MTSPIEATVPGPEVPMPDQCEELGRILGLDGPVAEQVLYAALDDEAYARNLLLCRRQPALLAHLLEHPPERPRRQTKAELAARGAGALVRWARTGFTVVDGATYERRLAACERCPDLQRTDAGNRVCARCGCRVDWKARLSSESCPASDPGAPELTRWREPTPAQASPTTTTT